MTPRVNIACHQGKRRHPRTEKDHPGKKFFQDPVYKGKPDNITGVIDSHLLLTAMLREDSPSWN